MKNTRLQFYYVFLVMISISFSTFGQLARNTEGEFGNPISFGLVPVAVANLPDGRLLTWSSQFRGSFMEIGDGATFTQYFDPFANGGLGNVDGPTFTSNTDHDMFCPGINNLPDGRILSAGGTTSERTSIFDPQTGLWTVASEMNIPRGYQGNVTLQDGNVFTVGGSWSGGAGNNGGKDAEIWSPTTGWITLGNITGEDIYTSNDLALEDQGVYRVDNHTWLWPAPNGNLFHAGPGEMMHWIDTDVPGGVIVDAGIRQDLNANVIDAYSMKGNTVMFDTGKILKTGGAAVYGDDNIIQVPARDNAFVIDLNNVDFGDFPPVTFVGNMAQPRTMHNSTVLPNGEVLITGGLTGAAVFTDQDAVLGAEIFNETTGWRQVAGMTVPRTYHSVAILMVDGRVFVGGGGLCDNTPDCVNHFDAEIYSPPYLFDTNGDLAQRPTITSITGNTLGSGPYANDELVAYGDILTIDTDIVVEEFSLIRFSAATHSTNNEQRRIPLSTVSGTTHALTIPDRNLLPPGYYMLFAMDSNGVPSVARTLRIGTALPLSANSNLVLDMRFEEAGGINLVDSSINNNDGVISQRDDNGVAVPAVDHQFVPGLFGNAIEFEGFEHNSNSLIDIPYSSSLESVGKQITISAWVWRDLDSGIPQMGGRISNVSVFAHDYLGSNGLFFGFHNTLYKWSFRTTTGYYDNYAGYAPLAGWNHIVASYDGETSKLYANGVLVGEIAASGDFILNNDTESELSNFTLSGFYDQRTQAQLPSYSNQSGITDEVNGKMDNVQVYNTVLGPEEIQNIFNEGLATGDILATDCQNNLIVLEYKVNDGNWQTNSNNRIVAVEGDEVFIRALGYTSPYFVTTQIVDGPTLSSTIDFNAENAYQLDTDRPNASNPLGDGLIDRGDKGLYSLTTENGCPTTFFVEVLGSCDPGETEIFAEYSVNGTWSDGTDDEVSLSVGDNFQLSVLPNNSNPEVYPIDIILPNGNIVSDNFIINSVATTNEGRYQFISAQGCTKFLDVSVEETDCAVLNLQSQYAINNSGTFISGAEFVRLSVGNTIQLSVVPDTYKGQMLAFEIAGPNTKLLNAEDLILTDVQVTDEGLYIMTSSSGCTTELLVLVGSNQAPVVIATATPTSGTTHLNVDFSGSTSTDDTGIVTYAWDFGDGTTADTADPQHIYTTVGSFTAILTVTDDEGLSDTVSVLITVNVPPNEAPVAIATATPISGTTPLNVDFSGSTSTDDTGILTYAWDFGEGTTADTADPQHIYTTVGSFTATLTVTDDEDLSDTVSVLITVNALPNEAPVAIATATPNSGTTPLTVDFTGSTSTDDTVIVSYAWDFGDGTTVDTADARHSYTTVDSFTTTLTVTDAEGLTDQVSIIIKVNGPDNQAPIANFSENPTNGTVGLMVNFDASQSTDDIEVTSYTWDFGDGNFGIGEKTLHRFETFGIYMVTLTVTDTEGLQSTDTISITVLENITLKNKVLKDISVYPNPVSNEPLKIDLSDFLTERIGISLYDIYGKLVLQSIADENHAAVLELDVSPLQDGVYFLELIKIDSDQDYAIKKIIKIQ
jgi:PKD repeat protein